MGMKRYSVRIARFPEVPADGPFFELDERGSYVIYEDVEADMQKAFWRGVKKQHDSGEADIRSAVQREREEMRAKLENLRSYVPDQSHDWCEGYKIAVSDMIGSLGIRGEQNPGKIARLQGPHPPDSVIVAKLNELVDDRNARRG